MKKLLIGVSVILGMTSCSKEELIPTEHNSYVNVSTHNQTWLVAYAVNIATIPGIQDINSDYSFYAMSGGERICCNVHTFDFHSNVSVDLTSVGYMDLVDGFFVEVDGMTYELDIHEIY
tara:strand:+ start:112 stop:468 length:357 start_codon:yes stop_codon:yes gene_type:complete